MLNKNGGAVRETTMTLSIDFSEDDSVDHDDGTHWVS
jgi:hypothetical protein